MIWFIIGNQFFTKFWITKCAFEFFFNQSQKIALFQGMTALFKVRFQKKFTLFQESTIQGSTNQGMTVIDFNFMCLESVIEAESPLASNYFKKGNHEELRYTYESYLLTHLL